MPEVKPTVDESPPVGVAVAAGDASTPLAWAAPVEPDVLLPPPTCTAPVELDALLLPAPTAAGADAANAFFPADSRACGCVAKGEDCTAPVECEALFAPLPFDVVPPGSAAVMPPKGVEASTAGSAVTVPICTTPVESDELFPVSASAGAAPTSAANAAVTAARDLDRMSISSQFVRRRRRGSTQAAPDLIEARGDPIPTRFSCSIALSRLLLYPKEATVETSCLDQRGPGIGAGAAPF